eukprot:3111900-Ditylum_brightwellii.AAC.1
MLEMLLVQVAANWLMEWLRLVASVAMIFGSSGTCEVGGERKCLWMPVSHCFAAVNWSRWWATLQNM